MTLKRGQTIGSYTILEPIGRGEFATVYKARQSGLNREIALKILHQITPDALHRFKREALLLAKLSHPNVISVFDFGVNDGVPWLALPYLPGGSIKGPGRRKFPPIKALEMAIQIARGVESLHEAGVIHRDLKTDNVLLDERGNCLVTDFGLARTEDATLLTRAGAVVGTLRYAAPESLQSGTFSESSDLYAVGLITYELFTGTIPFTGDSVPEFVSQILTSPPPPLPPLGVAWHDAIQELLDRALQKEPCNRHSSVAQLRGDLESILKLETETQSSVDEDTVRNTLSEPLATIDATGVIPLTTPRNIDPTSKTANRRVSREQPTSATETAPRNQKFPFTTVCLILSCLVILGLLVLAVVWMTGDPETSVTRQPPADQEKSRTVKARNKPGIDGPLLDRADADCLRVRERIEAARLVLNKIAIRAGIATTEIDTRLETLLPEVSIEVIWSPSVEMGPSWIERIQASRNGTPIQLQAIGNAGPPPPPDVPCGARLILVPGMNYKIWSGDQERELSTPLRRISIPDCDLSPTSILFRAPGFGNKLAYRIWDLFTGEPVPQPAAHHPQAPALCDWIQGLTHSHEYLIEIHPDKLEDLSLHRRSCKIPEPVAFNREFHAQLLDPLESYLRQEEENTASLTAGLRQLNDRNKGRQTGEVRSLAFHFSQSMRLYPSARSRGELDRILNHRVNVSALDDNQRREFWVGATVAMSYLDMTTHYEGVIHDLDTGPPSQEAMQLILGLGVRNHPNARTFLQIYLNRPMETRAERQWWTALWLDIDPDDLTQQVEQAPDLWESLAQSRKQLLFEAALTTNSPRVVPLLERIDPKADDPSLVLDIALHLAAISDPRGLEILSKWKLD